MPIDLKIPIEYYFLIPGNPKVQKNDLKIMTRRTKNGKISRFIGHSEKMNTTRRQASISLFKQYKAQKGKKLIDYLFSAEFIFYVKKASEADLDNLPSIFLDAMQGIKDGKLRVASILKDDKLVRELYSKKIVQGDKNYYGDPRTEIRIRKYQG